MSLHLPQNAKACKSICVHPTYLFYNSMMTLSQTIALPTRMGQSVPLLVYVRSFRQQNLQKNVHLSGIRTRIIGEEGKHADHLTTTTANCFTYFACLHNLSHQCDQMARLFFNIWSLTTMEIFLKNKNCQSRFNNLPQFEI